MALNNPPSANLSASDKRTITGILRQFAYIGLQVLVVFLLWKIADVYKSAFVQEHGALETAQSVLLACITFTFLLMATAKSCFRPILLALSSLAIAALIREHDAYLENTIPYVSWYFCWLFPIAGLYGLIRHRNGLRKPLMAFLRSNSFHMMLTSAVIIVPIAQCLGHRSFLQDMLGDPTINAILIRRIVEEPLELLGYIQILLAAFEFGIEFIFRRH